MKQPGCAGRAPISLLIKKSQNREPELSTQQGNLPEAQAAFQNLHQDMSHSQLPFRGSPCGCSLQVKVWCIGVRYYFLF
jgi:hypothetical protein